MTLYILREEVWTRDILVYSMMVDCSDVVYACTVEPLCKDTPEMRTSPLIRTSCTVPAT